MSLTAPQQTDLFGEKIEPIDICVFHDESGDYGYNPWVFAGLLWVRKKDISLIGSSLQDMRQRENYWGEIHFHDLPKSFGGEYGAKARVAQSWFELWREDLSGKTWFKVLAVQRSHPKYDHRRFAKDFHAYNRFTAMALKGGLAWHFANHTYVTLWIYSDAKSRRPGGVLGNGIGTDNFEEYLARRLQLDILSYRGPQVSLFEMPKCMEFPSDYTLVEPEHELLQLCDILLGSVARAVDPESQRPTKRWFAERMARLIQDVRKKPWEQAMGLHRRFSVTYFPNNAGLVYNDGPVGILEEGSP